MEQQTIIDMINILNNKLDQINRQLNDFISNSYKDNSANIDYIALMTDVELPPNKDINSEGE